MTREQKYPDTSTFHLYNANPKHRVTGDCTFRAICTALDQSWEQTVMEMAEMSCKTGYAINDTKGIQKYLESKGWAKHPQPRKKDNTKYTGAEWCKWLSINDPKGKIGNIVCTIGGHHVVAIVPTNQGDGINCRYKVLDTWDSTDGCIGNYWAKG